MILLIKICSCNLYSQNWLDNSKYDILTKLHRNKQDYRNVKVDNIKNTIVYDMYINNTFYSEDIRYFKNDTCYILISKPDSSEFNLEYSILNKLYGISIIENVWCYKKEDRYRIITIRKENNNSVITIKSFKDFIEYSNILDKLLINKKDD